MIRRRGRDTPGAVKNLDRIRLVGEVVHTGITLNIGGPLDITSVGAGVGRRYVLGAGCIVIAEGPNDAVGWKMP